MLDMNGVIYGSFATGFLIAALFFLRFWRRTQTTLMLIFSVSFALLSLSYLLVGITDEPREDQSWIYLLRLAAFVLILVGISWTNIRRSKS